MKIKHVKTGNVGELIAEKTVDGRRMYRIKYERTCVWGLAENYDAVDLKDYCGSCGDELGEHYIHPDHPESVFCAACVPAVEVEAVEAVEAVTESKADDVEAVYVCKACEHQCEMSELEMDNWYGYCFLQGRDVCMSMFTKEYRPRAPDTDILEELTQLLKEEAEEHGKEGKRNQEMADRQGNQPDGHSSRVGDTHAECVALGSGRAKLKENQSLFRGTRTPETAAQYRRAA